MLLLLSSNLAALACVFAAPLVSASHDTSTCRCIPGDACWPNASSWTELNSTVGGRLIATVPLASTCHDPHYDAAACALLQQDWAKPQTHYPFSAEIMAPYFQNQSCDPFTPRSTPCALGNYVEFAIDVRGAADVAAGLVFAQEKNVRVVIKNTGHDYLGKSTGKGALGIWTHNLKSIDFLDYHSQDYNGPAIKMGAGVQAFEAYAAANAHGLRVVGGECPTVGLAGGYTQGGGHSALTSLYGLGADQALEWEVVTASGAHIIATPTQNPSLYWALSGGGGGTYGVVISLTAKAHPDGPVGGATLTVLPTGITQDAFWEAVGLWHASLPAIVDSGAMAVHFVTPAFMQVFGLTAPGATTQDVNTLLHPYTSQLDARNISYTLSVTSFPTYYQHFDKYFGPLPLGVFAASQLTGGRLIPRSVVQTNNAALTATTRSIASNPNFLFTGIALSAAQPAPHVPNSVLPAWRTAIMSVAIIGTWNSSLPLAANHAVETELTNSIVPQLEALTPGSGCYLNEANFDQPNWQQDFYGANYWPLRAVKRAFDPLDLFYARTAVGSEVWGEDGVGRLCRV